MHLVWPSGKNKQGSRAVEGRETYRVPQRVRGRVLVVHQAWVVLRGVHPSSCLHHPLALGLAWRLLLGLHMG